MQQAIADALAAWQAAPAHVRMMAGAYVGPVLAALVAVGEEVEKLKGEKDGQ
jgi:hypothetical protein